MKRIIFLIVDGAELLDIAGPVQVFHEAAAAGAEYSMVFASPQREICSKQMLALSRLEPLPRDVGPGDTVIVAGSTMLRTAPASRRAELRALATWLRECYDGGAIVASVCVGAFLLAQAGLLRGRSVTTHWKRVEELQRIASGAKVQANRLFIFDGRIATSAGVAAGVDLALAMVERDYGSRLAAVVAREIVISVRRPGTQEQLSPFLAQRDHTSREVHIAQDWLVEHPGEPFTLESLAMQAGVSERTLTRQFKRATGSTVKSYATTLRLEHARTLLRDRSLTLDSVAERCGFAGARHLRRLWRNAFGTQLSESRQEN